MKKRTLVTILTLATLVLLTACSNTQQLSAEEPQFVADESLSSGEQLRERLLFRGNKAQISSKDDMEALWEFLTSNNPTDDEGLKWKLTDECSLNIIGARNLIKVVNEGDTMYFSFVTTIDCPTEVSIDDISSITLDGTYTGNNSKIWTFGSEREVK